MPALDIKFTWTTAANLVKAGLQDATPEGKKIASKTLFEMARTADASEDLVHTLEAIRARIKGEFDNPHLIKYGHLSADPELDVLNLANSALQKIGL